MFQFVAWHIVRWWHRVVMWFRSTFYFKAYVPTDSATLYYPTHTEDWSWSAVREPYPQDCLVAHEVSRPRSSGRAEYRSILLPNQPRDVWEPVQPPWWFVGAQMTDGNTIAITDTLAEFLVVGNCITPTLLERLNFEIPRAHIVRWMYVDPDTFEERTFPSEGITVQAYADITKPSAAELPHED